ncbi:hypothetical protein GGE65_004135 [Skermanella aerolata]
MNAGLLEKRRNQEGRDGSHAVPAWIMNSRFKRYIVGDLIIVRNDNVAGEFDAVGDLRRRQRRDSVRMIDGITLDECKEGSDHGISALFLLLLGHVIHNMHQQRATIDDMHLRQSVFVEIQGSAGAIPYRSRRLPTFQS